MANIDKTVKSKYQPKQTNVAWVDLSGETPIEKHFINGRWVPLGGGGGGGSSSSGPKRIQVDNINTIPSDVVESLEIGDIVVTPSETYIVTNAAKGEKLLSHAEKEHVTTVCYEMLPGETSWHISTGAYQEFGTVYLFIRVVNNPNGTMQPNILYRYGTLSTDTTFTLVAPTDNTMGNVYIWTFDTGSTPPNITWPTGISWVENNNTEVVSDVVLPVVDSNKHYEVTIIDGYATIISADVIQVSNDD